MSDEVTFNKSTQLVAQVTFTITPKIAGWMELGVTIELHILTRVDLLLVLNKIINILLLYIYKLTTVTVR